MIGFFRDVMHALFRQDKVLHHILRELHIMQKALQELSDAVEQQTTVVDSVVTLITQMATQIRDAADDPAEIRRLADRLEKNNEALAQAAVTNTDSEEGEDTTGGGEDTGGGATS